MCRDNKIFCNKIWQASRFIIGWALNLQLKVPILPQPQHLWQQWVLDKLAQTVEIVEDSLDKTNFHVATKALKNFFHHDLCDIYLVIHLKLLHGKCLFLD